jgi:hypothetical protein
MALKSYSSSPDFSKSPAPFLTLAFYTVAWTVIFYILVNMPIFSSLQTEHIYLGAFILLSPIILGWLMGYVKYSCAMSLSETQLLIGGPLREEIALDLGRLNKVEVISMGPPTRTTMGMKLIYTHEGYLDNELVIPLVGFKNPESIVQELYLITKLNEMEKWHIKKIEPKNSPKYLI